MTCAYSEVYLEDAMRTLGEASILPSATKG